MRKKLFAILMSAMMMVTFMPAMAFAGTAQTNTFYVSSWADDYTSVTGYYYATSSDASKTVVTIPTTRTLEKHRGGIKVEPSQAYLTAYGFDSAVPCKTFYYDWDCFKMADTVMGYDAFEGKFISGDAMKKNVNGGTQMFTVTAPAYDTTTTVTDGRTASVSGDALVNTDIFLNVEGYDLTKPYVQQEVTLTATPVLTDGKKPIDFFGNIASAKITVLPKAAAASDIHFYVDSVKGTKFNATGDAIVNYDGAEHTIVANEVPGFTVSFKQLNPTTNRYEAVTAPSFKDADTYSNAVQYTIKTTAGAFVTSGYLTLTVQKAYAPTIGFEKNDASNNYVFDVEEGFNVMDYIVVTPNKVSGDAKKQAADKKATEADKALLLEYFNDYCTVVLTPSKYDATKITATIVNKDLTSAETAALATKYKKTIKNNFVSVNKGTTTATFNVTGGAIDWVKAPLTKKYHNKKGTLKKTYTFQVEAKASSKVTYKLTNGGSMIKIDKNTGKVTVKKGLKVGTYTVKITASAGKYAADSYYMTIKMAKK